MEQPELGGKKHYHIALFVNTDTFNGLGSYDEQGTGLTSLIQNTWLRAMKIRYWLEYRTLVHFPNHPLAFLELNNRTSWIMSPTVQLHRALIWLQPELTVQPPLGLWCFIYASIP
ncbi:inovirus-type Gp2 protein [Yersinia similis]|uniref:YagK/YfjJ domain-containing protein n=1 Tax=Yersinia similis TaxID=367190 RepID=UPI00384E791F